MTVNMSIFGTHFAPAMSSINTLAGVINGTGAPGIYNTSYTPDSQYGMYNWCNMPHVRKSEYPMPNSEYTLAYVEVIHRHHKRTPYASNTFFKQDQTWDCSSNGPYHYAKNASGIASDVVPISWQGFTDASNPFSKSVGPGFPGSSCQFPQITAGGIEDSHQHGKDLAQVYRDQLGFLPKELDHDLVSFRVTNNVITSQVLGGLAKGMFKDVGDLAAFIQSSDYDSLEPSITCKLMGTLRTNYTGTNPMWTAHLNASTSLYARLDNVSGIANPDTGGWHTSLDHYYDNLSAHQCHGKSLPCSVNATSNCISQTDANTVYRLGNYEYDYYYRSAVNSTAYSALRFGAWMLELQSHMKSNIAGSSKIKYRHNVAHDGSMAPLLGLLQIETMVWPGMGSEVVFELWKKSTKNYVRVLWGGKPMKTSTPMGTLDMVPVQDFFSYLGSIIPNDLVSVCNQSA